jgi:hypothetical protein
METTFPDGLVAYINDNYPGQGVRAEFVQLDILTMDDAPVYDAVLDRISHEVPFYRSALKQMALQGTYVCNNPFWWSADDKFIDNTIAERVGVAVPKSAILPHKQHPPNTSDTSFRNLVYPLGWDRIFDYVGFPCFLKPHDGGGWRAVTKCDSPEDVYAAYDESGTDCMMLQEGIEFEDYFRCYGVGQRDVRIMRYNPNAQMHLRYKDVNPDAIAPDLYERVERDVLAICRALGYDLNTVEFAVRDGIPYAIDFMTPAPDADFHAVGLESYEWVIKKMADFLVEKAKAPREPMQFAPSQALGLE